MAPSIVRGLRVVECWRNESYLSMRAEGLTTPLSIELERTMQFGTEGISAKEYFWRVIEEGDLIDAVVSAVQPFEGHLMIDTYWIQIRYSGEPESAAGHYSKKDDGLFAMRTKAGEKAERRATRILVQDYGHSYAKSMLHSPGFLEIRYRGKKKRVLDRTCDACGLKLEIKKRNKDEHFRVSHSEGRPFWEDCDADGWHAFVFPDMRPRFVPNVQILAAFEAGQYELDQDEYDAWADIEPLAITVTAPPNCHERSPGR